MFRYCTEMLFALQCTPCNMYRHSSAMLRHVWCLHVHFAYISEEMCDADIACALLVAPMWPNQIVYSSSGILSYALAVIHKRIQTALNGRLVHDKASEETSHCLPREWIRTDVWHTAFNMIWDIFFRGLLLSAPQAKFVEFSFVFYFVNVRSHSLKGGYYF